MNSYEVLKNEVTGLLGKIADNDITISHLTRKVDIERRIKNLQNSRGSVSYDYDWNTLLSQLEAPFKKETKKVEKKSTGWNIPVINLTPIDKDVLEDDSKDYDVNRSFSENMKSNLVKWVNRNAAVFGSNRRARTKFKS